MIDIDLVNKPLDAKNYTLLEYSEYPILFLGFIIKNEYDNLRINIEKRYNPINILHFAKDRNTVTPLKGIKLTPNQNVKNLFSLILKQEKLAMNLITYENLLNQYGFGCKETYSLFAPGLYPVDFNNLKSICDDSFNADKKIFQHLLNLDEKVFDFQKFSSLKLFILTV